jgi:hypothetical protein
MKVYHNKNCSICNKVTPHEVKPNIVFFNRHRIKDGESFVCCICGVKKDN